MSPDRARRDFSNKPTIPPFLSSLPLHLQPKFLSLPPLNPNFQKLQTTISPSNLHQIQQFFHQNHPLIILYNLHLTDLSFLSSPQNPQIHPKSSKNSKIQIFHQWQIDHKENARGYQEINMRLPQAELGNRHHHLHHRNSSPTRIFRMSSLLRRSNEHDSCTSN